MVHVILGDISCDSHCLTLFGISLVYIRRLSSKMVAPVQSSLSTCCYNSKPPSSAKSTCRMVADIRLNSLMTSLYTPHWLYCHLHHLHHWNHSLLRRLIAGTTTHRHLHSRVYVVILSTDCPHIYWQPLQLPSLLPQLTGTNHWLTCLLAVASISCLR